MNTPGHLLVLQPTGLGLKDANLYPNASVVPEIGSYVLLGGKKFTAVKHEYKFPKDGTKAPTVIVSLTEWSEPITEVTS